MTEDSYLSRAENTVAQVGGGHLDFLRRDECVAAGNIGDERRGRIRLVLQSIVAKDQELLQLDTEIAQLRELPITSEKIMLIHLKSARRAWILYQKYRGPIGAVLFDCQQAEVDAGILALEDGKPRMTKARTFDTSSA